MSEIVLEGLCIQMSKVLQTLPVILITLILNVAITSIIGNVVLQLLIFSGWEKHVALVMAMVAAIGTYSYIAFQPAIRNYINRRSIHE